MKIKTFAGLKAWNRNPTIEKPDIGNDFFLEFSEALEKDDGEDPTLEMRHEFIVYKMICFGLNYGDALNSMKNDFRRYFDINRRFRIKWERFEGDI